MGQYGSHEALSELIGSIYDSVLDPDRWDATLAEIVAAFDGMTGIISLSDLRENRLLIYRQVGIEPEFEALLRKHEGEVNAEIGRSLATWSSLDQPYLISRHTTEEQRAASPYYQDCVRAGGVIDVMQYFLVHTQDRFSGFAVTRHEDVGEFTDAQIELGRLLLPHLRRAVAISNVLEARTIERDRFGQALDVLRCGVILTNEHGTIQHANRSAERMLSEAEVIESVRGRLQARHQPASKELRGAIGLAAKDGPSIGTTGLAILLSGPGVAPVFAHVLPIGSFGFRPDAQVDTAAAIFLSAAPDEQAMVEVFATTYGLTLAEQRLLALVLSGSTLSQAAERLGVAHTTVKSHLEGIFAKTGVNRQADLIRLSQRAQPPARGG